MRNDHQEVINCKGDTDTTIVETVINEAGTSSSSVVVVANDTDIAVVLMYHWKDSMADVIFYLERLQQGWSMKSVTPTVAEIKKHLFIHAWTGCDTVSAPFGKGKTSFLQLFTKSKELKDISTCMKDVWATADDFGNQSIDAFRILYHGKKGEIHQSS